MFYPKPGGSYEIVGNTQDGEYKCHIPKKPGHSETLFHNLPKHHQFWKRFPLPDFWEERYEEESFIRVEEKKLFEAGKILKVKHVDPVLEKYRRQEWNRRRNGLFFFNNGKPTYITKDHYFYLQWCHYDHKENGGYPLFYEFSRKVFYFREYCAEDPLSAGYIIIGPRGTGKTGEEVACVTNNVTSNHSQNAVIQSKSEADVKETIFEKKLVPLFNDLPPFFKPEYDHGTNPKNGFSFRMASKSGESAKGVKFGPDKELRSSITLAKPGEKVLDGDTISDLFEDEVGKVNPNKQADVEKRHEVNRKCVFRNHRKIGLMRKTSTVEEMNEGGTECHNIWKKSDPRVRDANGETTSKIYRYLISALETDTSMVPMAGLPAPCDVHGFVDADIANQKIENELEAVKNDWRAKSSILRKNPRNSTEAFIKDASRSIFNVFILTNRLAELETMKNLPYIIGNFSWKNGKVDKDDVIFTEDPYAGRFYVNKLLDVEQKFENQKKLANNMTFYREADGKKIWQPKNNRIIRLATDPIKYSKTKDPRASKAAIHGFELYNPTIDHARKMVDWLTNMWIFEYIHRPEDPETYYNDIILAIRYYGASILPESNIKELIKHLMDRGYGDCIIFKHNYDPDAAFIQNTRTDDGGMASTPEVINAYVTRLIAFINKHGHRIPFPRTIKSLLDFEPDNTTLYDATISAGYALIAAEAVIEEEVEIHETDEWFDEYDQSGTRGQHIESITDVF